MTVRVGGGIAVHHVAWSDNRGGQTACDLRFRWSSCPYNSRRPDIVDVAEQAAPHDTDCMACIASMPIAEERHETMRAAARELLARLNRLSEGL